MQLTGRRPPASRGFWIRRFSKSQERCCHSESCSRFALIKLTALAMVPGLRTEAEAFFVLEQNVLCGQLYHILHICNQLHLAFWTYIFWWEHFCNDFSSLKHLKKIRKITGLAWSFFSCFLLNNSRRNTSHASQTWWRSCRCQPAVSEVEMRESWGGRLLVCSSDWEWVSVDTGVSLYYHSKINSEPLF